MVQVPFATSVTEVPDMVHWEIVVEVKVTVRFDDAVALTVNGDSDKSRLVSEG